MHSSGLLSEGDASPDPSSDPRGWSETCPTYYRMPLASGFTAELVYGRRVVRVTPRRETCQEGLLAFGMRGVLSGRHSMMLFWRRSHHPWVPQRLVKGVQP